MNYKIAANYLESLEPEIQKAIREEYPDYPEKRRYINTKFIARQIRQNSGSYPLLGNRSESSIRQFLTSYFNINNYPRYTERRHGGRAYGIVFINPALAGT